MEKTKVTCSFGNDDYGLQTGNVKISDLHDFKGHPFKVEQDIQLFELMRSIEDKGVLVPLIVRSKRGKLSFKDEIKTYVRLVMNYECTKTVQDVVEMLGLIYGMDIRLKGKTIGYALPYDLNKGGKTKAVRGSKLGKRFTVEGIEQYLQEKERMRLEYQRTEREIEESKLTVNDYFDWEEQPTEDKSVYQAFDEFMERENIPENDESVFYGGVFQDFHREWQGIPDEEKEEAIDYAKIPMKDRAHLLPPPTDNTMEEVEKYKVRMGYNEGQLKSVRYRMSVYDDFLKEYDYRKKVKGVQRTEQKQKTVKKKRDYCR